ncbi:MAG: vitamin K epoxide reductase family protein [Desulfobacterales bacterium]
MAFFWILGMADTVYLTYHHYRVNILMPAGSSFCAVNEVIDCDKAATSFGSMFMGFPVATWGMFAFLFLVFFMAVERLLYWEIQKALYGFLLFILYTMALFSIVEAFISFFILNVVCIMCVFLYIIIILMVVACKRALAVSHLEFLILLRDLFFSSLFRTLLRKGTSVAIIALVFSGLIAIGLDGKFRETFYYQRVDIMLSEPRPEGD